MLEENQTIEMMIHLMELGMVVGIAVVVAFTVRRHKHEFNAHDHAEAPVAADHRPS